MMKAISQFARLALIASLPFSVGSVLAGSSGEAFRASPQAGRVGPLAVAEPELMADGAYVGEVRVFSGEKVPKGWLICDGKEYDQAAYPKLYASISDLWGSQTAGKFRVPDLRGVELRGWNQARADKYRDADVDGRELVPGAPGYPTGDKNHVGTYQMDQFQTHKHLDGGHAHATPNIGYRDSFACGERCGALTGGGSVPTTTSGANVTEPASITPEPARFGGETRSKNAYVLYGIRDGSRR